MTCMKCGREIGEDQAFCESCLTEMERNPVKPGTVILLPKQTKQPPKKPILRKKPALSPEEQIPLLKKRISRLQILILVMVVIIGILTFVTTRVITELDIQRLLGQNYSTIETSGAHTESPTEPGNWLTDLFGNDSGRD